jgi:pimeloyl-ACP methyl ester carboxylesterase
LRRAGRVALILAALIVGLAVLNALALSAQTKEAGVNVDGAEIVETSIGGLQVLDEGDPRGSPIVLIHCFTCSMRWWDELAPLLAGEHRVIRVDLLGHGGSDKPKGGYAIEEQARGVTEALAELGVSDATVVGHSLGGTVATAVALQSPELASSVVNIDQAPDGSYGELSLVAKLGFVPIIGQAMSRAAQVGPAAFVKDGYQQVFAPGFNLASGFEDPDQVVEDLRAMTYTAYTDAAGAEDDYTDEQPLDDRLAGAGIPLLVIFGAEDQIYDPPEDALEAYGDVPGARTALIERAGHSPNVETPERVAALILGFVATRSEAAAALAPAGQRRQGDGKPPGDSQKGGDKDAGEAATDPEPPQRAQFA